MKQYLFRIGDRKKDETVGEYSHREIYGWYSSRTLAILEAQSFCSQFSEYGLYVDWINEYDENHNETATIPFGDYQNALGFWPSPKELYENGTEYVWDEE